MSTTPPEKASTQEKIKNFIERNLPAVGPSLVSADNDLITVGRLYIVKRPDEYVVMEGRRRVGVMTTRRWAVAYAMAVNRNLNDRKREIEVLHDNIVRVTEDCEQYQSRLENSNPLKQEMYRHRLSQSESELETLVSMLNKTSRMIGFV